MLIGMVFTVMINTQRIAATLGQTSAFTLAEKITSSKGDRWYLAG
jgi:hypothetical protein